MPSRRFGARFALAEAAGLCISGRATASFAEAGEVGMGPEDFGFPAVMNDSSPNTARLRAPKLTFCLRLRNGISVILREDFA